jgi:hypothetical protein
VDLLAWTNGELLIWLDSDRGHALESIAEGFGKDLGIKVTIDTPENIMTVSDLPHRPRRVQTL